MALHRPVISRRPVSHPLVRSSSLFCPTNSNELAIFLSCKINVRPDRTRGVIQNNHGTSRRFGRQTIHGGRLYMLVPVRCSLIPQAIPEALLSASKVSVHIGKFFQLILMALEFRRCDVIARGIRFGPFRSPNIKQGECSGTVDAQTLRAKRARSALIFLQTCALFGKTQMRVGGGNIEHRGLIQKPDSARLGWRKDTCPIAKFACQGAHGIDRAIRQRGTEGGWNSVGLPIYG